MKLIFVYNAKSGKINALFDAGHKLINPKTYQCNLCALTHDTFSENKTWKQFRENSRVDMEFYHTDEFENIYPDHEYNYPVILKRTNQDLSVVLNAKAIEELKTVEELISVLNLDHNDNPQNNL